MITINSDLHNQDSLGDVLGLFQQLDNQAKLLSTDESLDDLGREIFERNESLEDLMIEPFDYLEGSELMKETFEDGQALKSLQRQVFKELESSDPLDSIIDTFKSLDGVLPKDDTILVDIVQDDQEEEMGPGVMFSDTVKQFGGLFKTLAGIETETRDFYLTYIDIILMIILILGLFLLFFMSFVLLSYCKRRLMRSNSWSVLSSTTSSSSSDVTDGDCSVSWISIDTSNSEYGFLASGTKPKLAADKIKTKDGEFYRPEEISHSILV